MEVREKIQVGNIIMYKNVKYVIVDKDIFCGGHFMVIEMIKLNRLSWFGFRKVYTLADEQIENCKIISWGANRDIVENEEDDEPLPQQTTKWF